MSPTSQERPSDVGQNADVPRIARPTPRPPADVITALAALDSEIKLALIAHFRATPDTVTGAAQSLKLAQQSASKNVPHLVRAGVLVSEVDPSDRRRKIYRVDVERLNALHTAMRSYTTSAARRPR